MLYLANMSDNQKPTVISLLGIHASGKTTIGEKLTELGIPYYLEIGNELIKQVDFNSPEKVAWFDREIMHREVARDDEIFSHESGVGAVETWHIGNIAYAQIRTPEVAAEYKELFKEQTEKCNPVFVFLDIDEETFRKRANLDVPLGVEEDVFVFYRDIRDNILSIFEELDIQYHRVDATQPTDKVFEDVREILRK